MAVLLGVTLMVASPTSAQVDVSAYEMSRPDGAAEDPYAGTLPISSACGAARRSWSGERLHDGIYNRAGHAFRGLGSPGHALEVSGGFGSALGPVLGNPPLSAFAFPLALNAVFANLSSPGIGGLCLTAGLETGVVGGAVGPTDDPRATGGHLAFRVGLLTRTPDDRTRLHVEAQAVMPSGDGPSTSPWDRQRLYQASASAALARGVDGEMMWLAPLEWGVRGIARFQYQWAAPKHPESGAWLEIEVSLGYGRLSTYYGPREGLVGGVRLGLLGGGGFSRSEWSLRAGPRFAIGVGSLWPSDFVLPFEGVLAIELGHTTHRSVCGATSEDGIPLSGSLVTLEGGLVMSRFAAFASDFGDDIYFRLGVHYTYAFDARAPDGASECGPP